jgi:antitoxin component of MazEF toxin-antitoxin module
MRTKEKKVSNGTLDLSQEILSYLNLKEGETVRLEANEDGSVTIRKKETIADLKAIIKKGETPNLHADAKYQFETSSIGREEL